tara:strand:+ start:1132 stop:1932 length:801 start_codon:yes stop_codon:yes gene_type:complete
MRTAAGLAAFAALTCAACTGASPSIPSAQPNAIPVHWSGPLARDFSALPRLTDTTPQALVVNGTLDAYDAFDSAGREDCLADAVTNENIQWSRKVAVPMTGPRFLTIVRAVSSYCGGAHGDERTIPVTFDLATGHMIDWSAWLPAGLAQPRYEPAAGWPQMLRSPTLKALYAERALASMDALARSSCAEPLADETRASLLLWLDARGGGLGMRAEGFAYTDRICGVSVVLPVDELERLGTDPQVVEFLRLAMRDHLWRDQPDAVGG